MVSWRHTWWGTRKYRHIYLCYIWTMYHHTLLGEHIDFAEKSNTNNKWQIQQATNLYFTTSTCCKFFSSDDGQFELDHCVTLHLRREVTLWPFPTQVETFSSWSSALMECLDYTVLVAGKCASTGCPRHPTRLITANSKKTLATCLSMKWSISQANW